MLWASPASCSRCACSCIDSSWVSKRLLSRESLSALQRVIRQWASHPGSPADAGRCRVYLLDDGTVPAKARLISQKTQRMHISFILNL